MADLDHNGIDDIVEAETPKEIEKAVEEDIRDRARRNRDAWPVPTGDKAA